MNSVISSHLRTQGVALLSASTRSLHAKAVSEHSAKERAASATWVRKR